MAITPAVLLVELIMSADRLIQSAHDAPTLEGEWPPSVVLGHVTQVDEQVWMHRIEAMLAAQRDNSAPPTFSWWEPDPQETRSAYSDYSLDRAGAELMASRTKMVTFLRGLTTQEWASLGRHETFGELDISTLLLEVLRHDEEHRASFVLGTD